MPDVVTIDQIRDLIKSENIRPSDIFPMEKLVSDPAVKGYAEDRVRERIGSEYQHRKSVEEELEKAKKDFGPKEAALLEQIKSLKATAAKAQLGSLLEKQRESRKLDEKQLQFIQNRMERFNPKDPDAVEKEFNAHLDSEIDEYGRIAKLFGVGGAEDKSGGKEKSGGTEPDNSSSSGGSPESKYVDPKQNDFIRV
ncbi:MAG: hypothetical protein WC583_02815 [Candidatus Omnitrophota bacterium]|nr:hypothetical protein [Sphaerochaeta sp.]